MKLLTDANMSAVSSITASSEMVNFPPVNLLTNDPDYIWKAAAGITSATITIDFGSAKSVDQIWLNNANFLTCSLQANDTDVWTSPAVDIAAILKTDDAKITKGFFALSATNYRYVRIEIPVQTLLSGAELFLGNIILGEALEIRIAAWQPQLLNPKKKFDADGGGSSEKKTGKMKHSFSVEMTGTVQEILYDIPWTWDNAIIFEDMSSVERSFLISSADSMRQRIFSPEDMQMNFTWNESTCE